MSEVDLASKLQLLFSSVPRALALIADFAVRLYGIQSSREMLAGGEVEG